MLESKPLKIKSLQLMPIANKYNAPTLHNHKSGLNKDNIDAFIDALDDYSLNSSSSIDDAIDEVILNNKVTDIIKINEEKIGVAKIANGWDNERFSFLLVTEIETDSGTLESYIQGYTEHKNQTDDGAVDQHMKFYINSINDIFRVVDPESNEEILLKNSNYNIIRNPGENLIMASPYEVFTNKIYSELDENTTICNKFEFTNDVILDRNSNVPLKFINRIIRSYSASAYTSSPHVTKEDILKEACGFTSDNVMMNTTTIQKLCDATGVPGICEFDLDTLSKIDPNIKEHVTILNVDSNKETTPGNFTSYVNNKEFNIANEVTHSISAILTDNLLSTIEFSISNKTGVHLISIKSVNSFIPGTDMNSDLENVISQIMLKVMPKVSDNNKILLDINVSCNILTDSVISVTIGDGTKSEFVFPTFADGLYSPIISTESALNEMNIIVDAMEDSFTIY